MSTPRLVPRDWIRSDPETPTIDVIRPNVVGTWIQPKETEPTITIKLVETGEEPVPVGRIQLISNVPSFEVYYKPSDDVEEFIPIMDNNDKKPRVNI